MKGRHRKLVIILIVILIVIVALVSAAYVFTARIFTSRFYPNTTVNGFDASLKTAEDIEEEIRDREEDYLLAVHDRDDHVTYINGKDIGYSYESKGDVQKLIDAQDSMLWPKHIMENHSFETDVNMVYDESKLQAIIDGMDCFKEENIVKPKDAFIRESETGYELVPEEPGTSPIKEQVTAEIKDAIAKKAATITLSDDAYEKAAITTEDPGLQAKMAVYSKYNDMKITYQIEGSEQVLEGSEIIKWITFDKDMNVKVDADKAYDYAQQLAYKYNTYADTRSFRTHGGDLITIGGGDYGWVIDRQGEADQLVEDIKAGKSVEREPCYEQRAFSTGKDDIGNTYVEIDYDNQHFWYYVDGSVVLDSDIVSGDMGSGHGSPDGVFKIITLVTDTTLVGEDYESPVSYFMPFAYNVGLHDADWRAEFGGEIYQYAGSHGCVNLPENVAESLFSQIEIGTPVIAYYRSDVTLKNENARISNAWSYGG